MVRSALQNRDTLNESRPDEFCRFDPLFRWLLHISPKKSWPIALLSLFLNTLIMVGGGLVVSYFFTSGATQFVPILAPSDVGFGLYTYLVYSPMMWLFYVWQPKQFSQVIQQLRANGVLGKWVSNSSTVRPPARNPFWERYLGSSLQKPIGLFVRNGIATEWMIIVLTVAAAMIYVLAFLPGGWLYSGASKDPYYFQLQPWYFWPIFLPFLFLNVYMLIWVFVRHIRISFWINALLQSHQIELKLFFPDQCNGFATVGAFATKVAQFPLVFGVWILLMIIDPQLLGQPAYLIGHLYAIFGVYLVGLMVFLLPLPLVSHSAMSQAKQNKLRITGNRLRIGYARTSRVAVLDGKEYLQEVERRYQVAEKEYHAWPFRSGFMTTFGIPVIIPLLTAVLAAILKK